ncbi:MAG: sigma 54-interacting transcriptional regulator [Vicinamibacterales bacterium]
MKRNVRLFIGTSAAIAALQDEIEGAARSDANVLILGESGVGKELVAESIHAKSRRASGPFVPINCTGIPEEALEAELFGGMGGSLGRTRDIPGRLQTADGGTVLLDEIGEITPRLQGLLLRFAEFGEVPAGDGAGRAVDVRVVVATNRDLRTLIAQRQFREDLYYRLNVINIAVPPLRERRDDIEPLFQQFLLRAAAEAGRRPRTLSPESLEVVMEYAWPGNVRELENVAERLAVSTRGEIVQPIDLPPEVRGNRDTRRPSGDRPGMADELYRRLVEGRESFWTAVYPLFMQREITRSCVRDVVERGLTASRGNYKVVARIFNMEETDYKRFLNFLRKHDCQVPFKQYRRLS